MKTFKTIITTFALSVSTLALASGELPFGASLSLPATTDSGTCYSKVSVPALIEKQTEKVLVKAPTTTTVTTPATFSTAAETVTVKEASKRIITHPATYKNVTEKVLVKEASEKIVAVPATFKSVAEKVMTAPARKVWKVGTEWREGALSTTKGANGETRCLVEVPAKYTTVTKKVVATPATTKKVTIPAEYKTVAKRVIDQPARFETVDVPAVTKSIQVRKIANPESSVTKEIPGQYRTIAKDVLVRQGRDEWHRVLCKRNSNVSTVKALQTKLKNLGFYKGPLDGIHGPSTSRAVSKYQSKEMKSSFYGGTITWNTLQNLGLVAMAEGKTTTN